MILNRIKLAGMLAMSVFFTVSLPEAFAQTSHIITDKTELAKLKAAVEAHPEDFETHWAYIRARDFDSPELIQQYEVWTKKYPQSVMFPYSIGEALSRRVNSKAKEFLLKALAIDPNYAAAWNALASDAERWGNFEGWKTYLGKAVAAAPKNADYAFYYSNAFSSFDEEKYRNLTLKFVTDFPEHQRAAQALYWLANRTTDSTEKIKYYEQLRNKFPVDKYQWSGSGMNDYFNLLLKMDPEKAIVLAEEMAADKEQEKEWSGLLARAKSISNVRKLIEQKKGTEALSILNQLKLRRNDAFSTDLHLLRAEANDAAGNTSAAYDSLVIAFTKSADISFKADLRKYGQKLGKNQEQVEADIWGKLEKIASPATSFNLRNYLTGSNSSLEDYKGKVILITYWYPGCGPCRAEFPHFENVVRKFKGQDLAYLGINIYSKQNDFVIPFVKKSGYSFIPLEDVKGREKGNLDNHDVAPVNFLIDKEGRVIFSNFRTDSNNEAELELMIKMLMEGKKA